MKNKKFTDLHSTVVLFAIILATIAFFVIVAKGDISSLLHFVGLLFRLISDILKSTKD